MSFRWNLDSPLLRLSPEGDTLTIRQTFEHIHVFGATGSGKSSAMATLSAAMLRAGYGFLVLTTKPDETQFWINHCRANGRGDSVVVFDESQGYNFIDHELARQGTAGLSNVLECILRCVEAADAAAGSNVGRPSDEFWKQFIRELLTHALPVIYSGNGHVSIASVMAFIASAGTKPRGADYMEPAFDATSFASKTLERALRHPVVPLPKDVLGACMRYWFYEFTAMDSKTRTNGVVSLTTKLGRFKFGRMRQCFCDRTTIVPESLLQGAVIIMHMPVLVWNEDGIIGQRLFKYMAQRTLEARNALAPELRERPVCIWMDEAQNFVDRDEEFLSTARSSRACVVAMSQSLPTYYSRQPVDRAASVKSFVGKFNTHIFMLNNCPETNTWASSIAGRGVQYRSTQSGNTGRSWNRGMNEGTNAGRNSGSNSSYGSSWSGHGGSGNHSSGHSHGTSSGENYGSNVSDNTSQGESWSVAEQMEDFIQSNYFAMGLRSGGPRHNQLVDAIWCRAGANFRSGMLPHAIKVTFKQQGKP